MLKQIETNTAYYYKLLYAPKGLQYLDLILNNAEYIKAFTKNRGAANVIFGGQNTTRGKQLYDKVVAKPEVYTELFNTWCKTQLGELAVKSDILITNNDAQSIINILDNNTTSTEFDRYTYNVDYFKDNVLLANDLCTKDVNNVLYNESNFRLRNLYDSSSTILTTKLIAKYLGLDVTNYNDIAVLVTDPNIVDQILLDSVCITFIVYNVQCLNICLNISEFHNKFSNSVLAMTILSENMLQLTKDIDLLAYCFNDENMFQFFINSEVAMQAIADSEVAMNYILENETFMQAIADSEVAMQAIADSEVAMSLVCASPTWLAMLINSTNVNTLTIFENSKHMTSVYSIISKTMTNTTYFTYTANWNQSWSEAYYYFNSVTPGTTSVLSPTACIVLIESSAGEGSYQGYMYGLRTNNMIRTNKGTASDKTTHRIFFGGIAVKPYSTSTSSSYNDRDGVSANLTIYKNK